MNKKLYWGLGVLFGLIIGGFVFLLVQQKAELNQWEADAAKDKKLATAETPPIVENKPPIVKNKPSPPEPGYEWVQHGDHWHKTKKALQASTPNRGQPKNTQQGAKQKHVSYHDRLYKKYDVPPPPPGYKYRMSDPGVLVLDDNGDPIMYKEGEAVFYISKVPGFAPTREQYKYYQELIRKRDHERSTGNNAAADQFNEEIRQLKAEAQGLIPSVSSSLGAEKHLYEAAEAEQERRSTEVIKQAYIDMGLGHMVSY